jgi:signal transduction histidine kinase/ActR/RegA family two-component response regulator/HPt (histidine-containing phosphotransfer) domain-containing protein
MSSSALGQLMRPQFLVLLVLAILLGIECRTDTYGRADRLEAAVGRVIGVENLGADLHQVHAQMYRALALRADADAGDAYRREVEEALQRLHALTLSVGYLRQQVANAGQPAWRSSDLMVDEYEGALRWLTAMMEVDFGAAASFVQPFDGAFVDLTKRIEQLEDEVRLSHLRQIDNDARAATVRLWAMIVALCLVSLTLLISRSGGGARRLSREVAALRELSAAKTLFLAQLGHELRNPLDAIVAVLRHLRSLPMGDEDRRHLRGAQAMAECFTTLLDSLQDVAAIEAGRINLASVPFDPVRLCAEVLDLHKPLVAGRSVTLDMIIDPSVPVRLSGDPDRVRQILFNIVANAVKHTTEGSIILTLCQLADGIEIEVQDTGPGLPAAVRDRIFQPFNRPLDSGLPGSGLGLHVCRQLVDAMHGQITLRDKDTGTGTIVKICLPLPDGGPIRSNDVTLDAPQSSGRALNILVVDDVDLSADMLAAYLGLQGHQSRAVYSLSAAMAAVVETPPDIAMVDLHLPDGEGKSLVAALRALSADMEIWIVSGAVTAEVLSALAAGADRFFPKPVNEEWLARNLRDWHGGSSVASGGSSVLDADRLVAWCQGVGAPRLRDGIVRLRGNAQNDLDGMDRLLVAGDRLGLARAAHRLASAMGTFGCVRASEQLRRLEHLALSGDGRGLTVPVTQARATVLAALDVLWDWSLRQKQLEDLKSNLEDIKSI